MAYEAELFGGFHRIKVVMGDFAAAEAESSDGTKYELLQRPLHMSEGNGGLEVWEDKLGRLYLSFG